MSIVSMDKIRIIGLVSDAPRIMETLTKSRCFEVKEGIYDIPQTDYSFLTEEALTKQSRVNFAIGYLLKQDDIYASQKIKPDVGFDYTPLKKETVRRAISCSQLFKIENKEEELLKTVTRINEISYRQNEIASQIQKINESIESFKVFSSFLQKFSDIKDTKKTFCGLFSAPNSAKRPLFGQNVYFEELKNEKNKLIIVVGLNENKEEILAAINEKGFISCPYNGAFTPAEAIKNEQRNKSVLQNEEKELFAEALRLIPLLVDLKVLYDFYSVMLERFSNKDYSTGFITVIEGWCPSYASEKIKAELIKMVDTVYFDIDKPDEKDTPPTLLKNSKLIQPFEDLTAMYTIPDYNNDRDPNIFMGFWFFFLFGIMAGDVVYGIMISAACLLLLKFKKMEQGMSRLIKLFGICGISSIIWGVMFGSFLGFSIELEKGFFFRHFSYVATNGLSYFGWFNPMEDPIKLLGLAIVAGMVHLLFAFTLKAIFLLKDKGFFSALFDAGFNILTILAIFCLGLDIFAYVFTTGELALDAKVLPAEIRGIFSKAGMILLVVSIAGIFLLSGRESLKKAKIGGWLGAGLNGLYGGLIGVIADILSYSRLFGLGLAGGAIAFAFNTLVNTIFFAGSNVVMFIIGGLLLAFLHVFNLAISLLGTYVHNARLQFLEYYGKFLTGEGKPFAPLGEKTKFTRLN